VSTALVQGSNVISPSAVTFGFDIEGAQDLSAQWRRSIMSQAYTWWDVEMPLVTTSWRGTCVARNRSGGGRFDADQCSCCV